MTDPLRILEQQALTCTACRLADTRTNVVFGVGNPDAELMFVGEAPGKNEDLQGEPFVGAAGSLLNQLMTEVGIDRSQIYIANVIKCRPPNNRDPLDDEIECCKGFLRQQLLLVNPRVVATLGNFASKLLLKTDTGITKLRGRAYPWWRGSYLVPTFHPAAALRSGEKVIASMREDFALIRRTLDLEVRSPQPEPEVASTQMALFG
jgi:DNA polymerase